MSKKIAVILFNLGGPNSLSDVRPFLFNLFYDRHIINLPNPFRYLLATLISHSRKKTAIEIYKLIGNRSPIFEFTKNQASALEHNLNQKNINKYKTFVCMRYSHPYTEEVVQEVAKYEPDSIILLPLYPQYSTTTTLSSIKQWQNHAKKNKLSFPTKIVCCYYYNSLYVKSHCELILQEYKKAKQHGKPRLLFSAHSLPISIVEKGDPYPWQIENNVRLVVSKLNIPELDWIVCYQSKIGPIKWLTPSTQSEIIKAKKDDIPIIIIPIAFVSEHSETLVELDIEYKSLFPDNKYFRVPTLNTNQYFIECLTQLCLEEKLPYHSQIQCPCKYKMCWKNLHNK